MFYQYLFAVKGKSVYSISTEMKSESDAVNAFVGVIPTICILFKSNGTAGIDLVRFKMHILGSIKTIFSVISRKKIILNVREAFLICTRSLTSSPYNLRLKVLINLYHLLGVLCGLVVTILGFHCCGSGLIPGWRILQVIRPKERKSFSCQLGNQK